MHSNQIDLKNFQLQDTQTSSRGAKTAQLLNQDGSKIALTIGSEISPSSTPFGAHSFNDEASVRKTLDFRINEEEAEFFKKFDSWAVTYLSKNSEGLFKKAMTPEQVQEHYKSPVSQKEGYQPLLRTKINTSGSNAVRCWHSQRERIELPEDLRGCQLLGQVHLSHLWIMGRDFGWVISVQDLMVLEMSLECPFD
jgi:hypothetical protein